MTSNELIQLSEAAIQLELNVGKLYLQFHELFAEDAEFWTQLSIEENHHAALIRSGVEFFMQAGIFPAEMLTASLLSLQKANQKLITLQRQYELVPPSREEAFNAALMTERSAGEIHFQQVITRSQASRIVELFQMLNEDDKNHSERIQAYMEDNGIVVWS
jgi:hypothetical protein